jgi:4-hydroxy-3-polyprenylbenzoate decarboxylase
LNVVKDGSFSSRRLATQLLEHPGLTAFSIACLCDAWIDLNGASLVLWKIFNNVDPKRDILKRGRRVVVDATRKGPEDGHDRPWPDDIVMDPEVVERVRRRAKELGIEAFLH